MTPRRHATIRGASHFAFRLVVLVTLVLCVPTSAFGYACPQNPPPPPTETYQGFLGRVYELNGQELPYRLFVPKDYDATKAYPLVLYLHHAGLAGSDSHNETGWDNCVQLTSEIGSGDDYGGVFTHQAVDKDGKRFDTQQRYPHFVLAPHAKSSAYGFGGGVEGSASGPEHPTRPLLMGILASVQADFNIDPARLYVTGISMGCYGTWDLIMRKPGMFAAASPQSCRGDPDTKLLAALKGMPVWSMCGTKDMYFAGAQAMANGMKQVGATDFMFTPFEGVGHSINDRGYDYPGFIDWMFEQHLSNVPASGGTGSSGAAGSGSTGGGTHGGGTHGGEAGTPTMAGENGGSSSLGGSGATATPDADGTGATAGAVGAAGAPTMAAGGSPSPPRSDAEARQSSGCSLVGTPLSSTPFVALSALGLASAFWRRSQRSAKRESEEMIP